MSLIKSMRRQICVYWSNPVADGNGDWIFDLPVEISCRWEDTQKLFIDKDGKQSVSNAKVYVDRDMAPGEFLWLGRLSTFPELPRNPREIDRSMEIRAWSKLPNLKNTEYLRTATV